MLLRLNSPSIFVMPFKVFLNRSARYGDASLIERETSHLVARTAPWCLCMGVWEEIRWYWVNGPAHLEGLYMCVGGINEYHLWGNSITDCSGMGEK